MTRINVIPVEELTDQHLMAEYRELPMVPAAARRSNPARYKPSTVYTLNKGHVLFFFNKQKFLMNRWLSLIEELYSRGFAIDPESRQVAWKELDKFPQVDWQPDNTAISVNKQRIEERINQKPQWYRYRKIPLQSAMLT
jgi:deoxyribonuclease (pyrimidine dimer)